MTRSATWHVNWKQPLLSDPDREHFHIYSPPCVLLPAAPVFVTLPRNQESIIGGEAVFQCVAVGLPIPAISWQRNGIVLHPISGLVSIRGGYLQLLSVEPETAGTYTCVATNLVTSVHANATLTVHGE